MHPGEVAERVPDCTLVTIDAGHDVHEVRPEAFCRTVTDWLTASDPLGDGRRGPGGE